MAAHEGHHMTPTGDAVDFAGYQCLKMGHADTAVALLTLNVADNPRSARAHFGLGRALEAAGYRARARSEYRAALAIDTNDARAKAALAALQPAVPSDAVVRGRRVEWAATPSICVDAPDSFAYVGSFSFTLLTAPENATSSPERMVRPFRSSLSFRPNICSQAAIGIAIRFRPGLRSPEFRLRPPRSYRQLRCPRWRSPTAKRLRRLVS